MPLYKLIEEMPYEEFIGWLNYFNRRPIGWQEDLRAAYIMQSFGAKIKPDEIFPSLKSILNIESNFGKSLKQSMVGSMLRGAVGGEKLEFL